MTLFLYFVIYSDRLMVATSTDLFNKTILPRMLSVSHSFLTLNCCTWLFNSRGV